MQSTVVGMAIAFVALCLALLLRRDWPRLQGVGRSVTAEITGFRSEYHNNARTYAPIYRFDAEGTRHEVIDQVYAPREHPPVGTRVTLHYPAGRPDLARPARPLTWLWTYGVLLLMLGLLIGKATGLVHH